MPLVSLRAIRPGPFRSDVFPREARRVTQRHIARVKRDFYKTTRHWGYEVVFRQRSRFNATEVGFEVYTTNQIYAWVNDGTGQAGGFRDDWYRIAAKNTKYLHYQKNYTPASRPGVIDSREPREFGEDIFRKVVFHPGIEPRKFDEAIFNKRIPEFIRDLDAAMDRAVELSGHEFDEPSARSTIGGVISNIGRMIASPIQGFASKYFRINEFIEGGRRFFFGRRE